MTELSAELVSQALSRALELGADRGFPIACGIVDASGRPVGLLKKPEALWITSELALGKATLSSAFREHTDGLFERWQRERPQFGASVAAWGVNNQWFVGEGGAPIKVGEEQRTVGAVGISGCFPATIDAEVAREVADWVGEQLRG